VGERREFSPYHKGPQASVLQAFCIENRTGVTTFWGPLGRPFGHQGGESPVTTGEIAPPVNGLKAVSGSLGEPKHEPKTCRFTGILHRGDDRNRTGVDGFAGRCVATPPRRRTIIKPTGPTGHFTPRPRPSVGPAVDRLEPFPGRLAQLGERRLDKAEVTGSSPVSPIFLGSAQTCRPAGSPGVRTCWHPRRHGCS
jgi:hypothetical protein